MRRGTVGVAGARACRGDLVRGRICPRVQIQGLGVCVGGLLQTDPQERSKDTTASSVLQTSSHSTRTPLRYTANARDERMPNKKASARGFNQRANAGKGHQLQAAIPFNEQAPQAPGADCGGSHSSRLRGACGSSVLEAAQDARVAADLLPLPLGGPPHGDSKNQLRVVQLMRFGVYRRSCADDCGLLHGVWSRRVAVASFPPGNRHTAELSFCGRRQTKRRRQDGDLLS